VFVRNTPGILPEILAHLLNARAAVRKQMKTCTDPVELSLLDGRQLAFKITANSLYGFCGAGGETGKYPCLAVSDSTTAEGRRMIKDTMETIERTYENCRVIYGDTDSVMVRFGVQTVQEAFRLGTDASELITRRFGGVVCLQMEKVYHPYLLFGKKRYLGNKYMKPNGAPDIDVKGVEMVRRDCSDFVANTCTMVLDCILIKCSIEHAVKTLQGRLMDLVSGIIPFSELVLSKSLNTSKAANETLAQVVVTEKIRKRNPGSEPKSGDRVYYVITDTGNHKAPLYTKVEHSEYAEQHKIPLDYQWYINSVKTPINNMMGMFVQDPAKLYVEAESAAYRKQNRVSGLEKFMTSTPTTKPAVAPTVAPGASIGSYAREVHGGKVKKVLPAQSLLTFIKKSN